VFDGVTAGEVKGTFDTFLAASVRATARRPKPQMS
jgi:hypothetical protein